MGIQLPAEGHQIHRAAGPEQLRDGKKAVQAGRPGQAPKRSLGQVLVKRSEKQDLEDVVGKWRKGMVHIELQLGNETNGPNVSSPVKFRL